MIAIDTNLLVNMFRRMMVLVVLMTWVMASGQESAKPKIAFFPLGGNALEDLREKCGFSLRAKLDRAGVYEVIDGPKMLEIAGEAKAPITFETPAEPIKELAKLVEAQLLVWGDLVNSSEGSTIRVKMLDLRDATAQIREVRKVIAEPTDLRFVSEGILETLPGVMTFEHPSEEGVLKDATADALWKKNPDLMKNGDFSVAGGWHGIYQAEYYETKISDKPADLDKVVIWKMPEKGKTNNVLSMNLSIECAENNGLACLSDSIKIQPDTRYRITFRYKSDGPMLHVFIKGYTMFDNIEGKKVEREIYRRQVPPTGDTKGEWVTIVDELNPQQIVFPVQTLKVDLYAYLTPGTVMFDDVVLKAVGKQNRKATDAAIAKPIDRPKGAK